MSSAFRNFFLTLLLSLIVFGLVAWKLIPSVESALLGPADESVDVSDDASDSGDVCLNRIDMAGIVFNQCNGSRSPAGGLQPERTAAGIVWLLTR